VLRGLMKARPRDGSVCRWQHDVAREMLVAGSRADQVHEITQLVALSSALAKAKTLPAAAIADCRDDAATMAGEYARVFHQEANKTRNVEVTICVVDDSGNLLFLEKADGASLNTIQFAQKKARHAAAYGSPSKDGADYVKKGNVDGLAFPDFFPNQGGLPIKVDGKTLGGIAASGAKSEIDEAIAQAGIDAAFKK